MIYANKKILIIEPDEVLGETYQRFLEEMGFNVTRVKDAKLAIDSLDVVRPDLIILELLLMGHNGIEFLYEIRSYGDLRPIPAIILSDVDVQSLDKYKNQLELLGIKRVLYKPSAKLTQIGSAIKEIL